MLVLTLGPYNIYKKTVEVRAGCRLQAAGCRRSDLAVLQVGVNVLDQRVVRVADGEYQLAEGAAPHLALLRLHPQLQHK